MFQRKDINEHKECRAMQCVIPTSGTMTTFVKIIQYTPIMKLSLVKETNITHRYLLFVHFIAFYTYFLIVLSKLHVLDASAHLQFWCLHTLLHSCF